MFKTKTVTAAPRWDATNRVMAKLPPHYPVLIAPELLKGKKVQTLLNQLKTLAFVPDKVFEEFYLQAINEYAEFVQGLPASQIEHFNYHGGLLELGIRRAIQTLAWYRREAPIRQYTPEQVPARQAIWSYALFTAGLFYGLGQIVATYWVMLCHEDGAPHIRWNPILSKMANQGQFYRYSFETIRRDDLAARSTPLVAKEIMNASGLAWIASDHDIFNQWLAILLNDADHAGLFAKLVLPIDNELTNQPNLEAGYIIGDTIKHYDTIVPAAESDTNRFNIDAISIADAEMNPANQDAPAGIIPTKEINAREISGHIGAPEIGVLLINWLRNGVRGHSIRADHLVFTPAGLYLSFELISKFTADNPLLGSPQDAMRQLEKSFITRGKAFQQAGAGHSLNSLVAQQKVNGLIIDATFLGRNFPGKADVDLTIGLANTSPFPATSNAFNMVPNMTPGNRK